MMTTNWLGAKLKAVLTIVKNDSDDNVPLIQLAGTKKTQEAKSLRVQTLMIQPVCD